MRSIEQATNTQVPYRVSNMHCCIFLKDGRLLLLPNKLAKFNPEDSSPTDITEPCGVAQLKPDAMLLFGRLPDKWQDWLPQSTAGCRSDKSKLASFFRIIIA